LICAEAEAQTGIRNQQVSRWRKRLADSEVYRGMLIGYAQSKAMQEANNALRLGSRRRLPADRGAEP
jgi:hypothetical protein